MTSRILALHPRLLALGLIASLTLTGCGGGGGDAATSSPNAARTTLSGAVVKGGVPTL